mgnify:CR=1 FL=1
MVSKPAHQTLVVPPQCGAVTNSGIAKSALQKGIYLGDEAIGCGGGGKRHRIKSYGRGSFCSENRRGSTINRKSAAFFLGLFIASPPAAFRFLADPTEITRQPFVLSQCTYSVGPPLTLVGA